MDERGRKDGPGRGCTPFVVVFALGGLLGALAALALSGLGPGYLVGRLTGSAPALVEATAVPTPVAALRGAAAPGRRNIWRVPVTLNSDTSDPDMLLISRNYDRGSDSLVYLSPDARTVRWESAPMGENGNSWVVAYDAEMVYVADGPRLLGLGRGDGALRWEAPLSDRISANLCRDCLQAINGAVVALSDDGVIQAFTGLTGAPRWSVRLREATRQLVALDDMVGAPDRRPGVTDSSAGLYLFDVADGAPAGSIEPACTRPDNGYEDRPHFYDQIYRAPGDDALVWLLDTANCIVRVAPSGLSAGEPIFVSEEMGLSSVEEVFFGPTGIFFVDDGKLRVVDADGERELLATEDYSLRPLAADGATLLLEARRQRGSSRLELWAVDRASGARRWERVLAGEDAVDGAYDSGDWAAVLDGDAVVLIEQRGDPATLAYELIGMGNGVSRASATLPVDRPDDYLHGLTLGGSAIFVVTDQLYAIDRGSGQVLFRWP